jgi:hypothetical protein
MKTISLNPKNINKAIKSLRETIVRGNDGRELFEGLLLPRSEKVLSRRYSGKGRPRKKDYDDKKIDWNRLICGTNGRNK